MLIDFKVKNFHSIKDEILFTMETGSNVRKYPQNVIKKKKCKLLKSAVLFGPNGSGKTSILKSLLNLKTVVTLNTDKIDDNLPYEPFVFDKETKKLDTKYNIRFTISENIYNYQISFNENKISDEKLSVNDRVYFDRKQKEYPSSLEYVQNTFRDNKSIILYGQGLNDEVCKAVYLWFKEDLIFVNNTSEERFFDLLKDDETKKKFLDFLYFADTSIVDLELIKRRLPDNLLKLIKKYKLDMEEEEETLILKHKPGVEGLDYTSESSGTFKMILFALIILSSKNNGKLIIFDEFDIFFHFGIIESLIRLMNHEKSNNQYLLSSHQFNIMDQELRRDQIWIVDKNKELATTLTSIFDYELRTDMKISTQYLHDKFSGLPIVNIDKIEKVLF